MLEVAVTPAVARTERAPIIGHGSVRPKKQIDVVPQVTGKLLRVHPNLQPGKIIPKGDLLFEIEPTMYETRVRQVEAETRALAAALDRHEQELKNVESRIANARKILDIEERDLATSRRLYEEQNVGTARDVDVSLQKFLRQKDIVTELENHKAMIPHLRLDTQARLDASRAKLERAKQDLANTKIFCPFKARVELVQANEAQVVTAHFSIARLTDMSAFEVSVALDPRDLVWLDNSVRPEALTQDNSASPSRVTVRWSLRGQEYSWQGTVSRFERMDEATRTAKMVVEIRDVDMVGVVVDGEGAVGPALSIGMFCSTELPARPLTGALLAPRHAVYDNRWVYVFEPDPMSGDERTGTLARRNVPMLRSIGDDVLVDYDGRTGTETCELAPGDLIVTSRLLKPVVGMRVRMRDDRVASAVPVAPTKANAATKPAPVGRALLATGFVSRLGGG